MRKLFMRQERYRNVAIIRKAKAMTIKANDMLASMLVSLQSRRDAIEAEKTRDIETLEGDAKAKAEKSLKTSLAKFDVAVKLVDQTTAKVFAKYHLDADVFNRRVRANDSLNVYAIRKIIDLANALNAGSTRDVDVYTPSIFATLVNANVANVSLDNKALAYACSNDTPKHKQSDVEACIVRNARTYDLSTCNTQASSSKHALLALRAIEETNEGVKLRDAGVTRALRELFNT